MRGNITLSQLVVNKVVGGRLCLFVDFLTSSIEPTNYIQAIILIVHFTCNLINLLNLFHVNQYLFPSISIIDD